MVLPDGEKILMICLFILTQLTNVTDRHTDRHRMTAKAALQRAAKIDATGTVERRQGSGTKRIRLVGYKRKHLISSGPGSQQESRVYIDQCVKSQDKPTNNNRSHQISVFPTQR